MQGYNASSILASDCGDSRIFRAETVEQDKRHEKGEMCDRRMINDPDGRKSTWLGTTHD